MTIAYVKLTNLCNMHCSFCYNKDRQKTNAEEILKSIKTVSPKRIVLLGGEPMLRTDLVKNISKLGINTTLVTNGTIPIPENISININISYSEDRKYSESQWKQVKQNLSKGYPVICTVGYKQLKKFKRIENPILFERLINQNSLYYSSFDEFMVKSLDLVSPEKNLLLQRTINSIAFNKGLFIGSVSNNCEAITIECDGSIIHTCPMKNNKVFRKECISCKYLVWCKGDCPAFRHTCCFPKKFFDIVREKYEAKGNCGF